VTMDEVRSLIPGAEIVEFNPKFRYLILIDPEAIPKNIAIGCLRRLYEEGVWSAILFTSDMANSVRVLELKDGIHPE
jgi:hypothetical protein